MTILFWAGVLISWGLLFLFLVFALWSIRKGWLEAKMKSQWMAEQQMQAMTKVLGALLQWYGDQVKGASPEAGVLLEVIGRQWVRTGVAQLGAQKEQEWAEIKKEWDRECEKVLGL